MSKTVENSIKTKGRTIKKSTKIIVIIMIVVLVTAILAGIIAGIVIATKITPYEGFVTDAATGDAIEGVSVSDGKNVVKTDKSGAYKLKGWYKSNFVTVTIPSGYWTEQYYLRASNKTESYNFKLDKQTKDYTNHNFLQVTDTEIGAKGVGKWIDEVKDEAKAQDAAFIMQTGDICYEDGLREHIKDMNSKNMGVPVRYAIGNHDYVEYGSYGEQLFETIYGPIWYSFDVGNIHYVVTPMGSGDVAGKYNLTETWKWLANDLANMDEGKKVVIFNHDNAPDEENFVVKAGTKKLDLKEKGLISWIFGHWHYNMVNVVDGVYNICTSSPSGGGIDSSPAAIRTIRIENNTFKSTELRYVAYGGARETQQDNIWQSQLDGRNLYSSPLVVGDKVYVATIDDSYPNKPSVNCIDINTGAIIWTYKPTNSVRSDLYFADDKIVFQDTEGYVYAVDNQGKEVWKKDLKLTRLRNTTLSIIVEGNVVYCGNSRKVTALNLSNGDTVWENKLNKGENAPYRLSISGDKLVVGAHWNQYYFLNKNSGKTLDKSESTGLYTTCGPVFYDGKMLVMSNKALIEMDMSGKTLREHKFDDYTFNTASSPYISGGIAYISTSNKGIVAINMSDFSVVYNYATGVNMVHSSPYNSYSSTTVEATVVEHNGKLYFGANDGYIHCIDKLSGALVQKYDIGAPILSKLAIVTDANGKTSIIAADFAGRVTKIAIA